jgi:hypothetical protein
MPKFHCLRDAVKSSHPKHGQQTAGFFSVQQAPAHRSLVVKRYPAKHKVMALEHLSYSTDLPPPDFPCFCNEEVFL